MASLACSVLLEVLKHVHTQAKRATDMNSPKVVYLILLCNDALTATLPRWANGQYKKNTIHPAIRPLLTKARCLWIERELKESRVYLTRLYWFKLKATPMAQLFETLRTAPRDLRTDTVQTLADIESLWMDTWNSPFYAPVWAVPPPDGYTYVTWAAKLQTPVAPIATVPNAAAATSTTTQSGGISAILNEPIFRAMGTPPPSMNYTADLERRIKVLWDLLLSCPKGGKRAVRLCIGGVMTPSQFDETWKVTQELVRKIRH